MVPSKLVCLTRSTTAKLVSSRMADYRKQAFLTLCLGRVYNVTKRAVGVVVTKRIKNRYIAKKINVRVEHIKHSKCRKDFLE